MSGESEERILIVDDDIDHNDLQKDAILSSFDSCTVLQAHDPDECLEAVAKSELDLIVLDYTLPGMDGLTLMEQVHELNPDIPVLMVTGHGDENVAVEAMKQGAYDYLVKTPDMQFLEALPLMVKRTLLEHRVRLEKMELEEQVRQTKDYLEKIIENAGEAILVLDSSGNVVSINQAGQEMFDKKGTSLFSSSIYVLAKSEEDRGHLKQALDSDRAKANRIDLKMLGPAERTLDVSVCISWIEVNADARAVLIMRDMTQLLDMQRQLIEREKLAAIGELVGSVGHELNNKLGPILGYAELMQRSVKDEKTRQRLRVIEDSALKAKGIIEALLGFSRHRKALRSYFDLNKVLHDALSLMEFQLKKNKVKVDLQFAEDLPDVFADSVQVQQVFVNLLKNAYQAVQHLDDKRILVRTAREGSSLMFSVCDNGVGISEFNLDRVFKPFFRTGEFGNGAGLGLSVAYGIVKEHNGDIALSSTEKGGTEVVVRLPMHNGSDRSPQDRAPRLA
ncbi:MAG TPA: response regulator [bacterium]|nr:response regulator [bacterium]